MTSNNELAQKTLEELQQEANDIQKKEKATSFLYGFLISILLYGIVKNGFGFLHLFLPILLISIVYKNSIKQKEKLKKIKEAINSRS